MARRREVSTLEVRLSGNVSEALQGLNQVGARAQKLGRSMRRTGYSLSRNFTAPLTALGVAAGAAAVKASEFADSIDKASIRTGIARQELQAMKFAGDQLGVSFDALEKGVEAISRRLPQFEAGTGNVGEAWKELGVNLRDTEGELRPMGDLFPEILDSLSGVENATQRNAIAMQLFGRRGAELIPVLEAGEGRMGELMSRARELGIVVGDDQVGAFVEFKDTLSETLDVLRATGLEVASTFLPVFQETLLPLLRDRVAPAIRRLTDAAREINPVWLEMAAAVGAVAAAAGPVMIAVGSLSSLFGLMLGPAGLVVAALGSLAAAAVAVARNWEGLKLTGLEIWSAIQRAVITAVDGIFDALERVVGFLPGVGEKVQDLREDFRRWADDSLSRTERAIIDQEEHLRDLLEEMESTSDETDQLADRAREYAGAAGEATSRTEDLEEKLGEADETAGQLRGTIRELDVETQRMFEDITRRITGEEMMPSDQIQRAMQDIAEGRTRLQEMGEAGEEAGERAAVAAGGVGDALEQGLKRGVQDFQSLQQVGLQVLDALQSKLIDTFVSALFGGASGGPFGFLGGLFGGGRQHGGPVQPGRAFLVGERGPELFVPPRVGKVIPDLGRAAAAGGGGAEVTVQPSAAHTRAVQEMRDALQNFGPMTRLAAVQDGELQRFLRAAMDVAAEHGFEPGRK